MCGIFGTIPSIDEQNFANCLGRLAHRGPDGSGVWHDTGGLISLGHHRLAILDVSDKAGQPFVWRDKLVITFNGEIYNFIELRGYLQSKGYKFETSSDTEVLAALWWHEGAGCLDKLNGMWSFGVFNLETLDFFLCRDRLGEKPLFFIKQPGLFAFASEMKALYPLLPDFSPDYDFIEAVKLNMFSYEATEHCLIKGIHRFPAASIGVFKNGDLTIRQFWQLEIKPNSVSKSYADNVVALQELFFDACKLRLRSDVPVGVALSGGIDSTSVLGVINAIAKTSPTGSNVRSGFIASFPGTGQDETKEAVEVANYIGVDHEVLVIDPLKDIEKIYHLSYLFEEMYITTPIPFIQLYNKVKNNGVSVTIDGHGSDEIFGGYHFDIGHKINDDYPNPFEIKRTLETIEGLRNSGKPISWGRVYLEMKNRFLGESNNRFKERERLGSFNSRLYESTFKTILPTLLRNYDRYSMINGVEIRMPFLDYRVVEFAFSLPAAHKVKGGYSKAIVRDAFKGFIPDSIRLKKEKIGFNSPFKSWIEGPLREWFLDQLESQSFRESRIINHQEIRQLTNYILHDPTATDHDGFLLWEKFNPYVWEQSLKFRNTKL